MEVISYKSCYFSKIPTFQLIAMVSNLVVFEKNQINWKRSKKKIPLHGVIIYVLVSMKIVDMTFDKHLKMILHNEVHEAWTFIGFKAKELLWTIPNVWLTILLPNLANWCMLAWETMSCNLCFTWLSEIIIFPFFGGWRINILWRRCIKYLPKVQLDNFHTN